MRKQKKGFSLIELLIVVAIILIIAAIAIPSLIRAKASAKQGAAATSVRNIGTAEQVYHNTYPFYGALNNLGPGGLPPTVCPATGPVSTAFCALDSAIAGAATTTKGGYKFNVAQVAAFDNTFTAGASPATVSDGANSYCQSYQDLVVRVDPAAGAVPVTDANCITFSPLAQN